jgi:hypothetical protein
MGQSFIMTLYNKQPIVFLEYMLFFNILEVLTIPLGKFQPIRLFYFELLDQARKILRKKIPLSEEDISTLILFNT